MSPPRCPALHSFVLSFSARSLKEYSDVAFGNARREGVFLHELTVIIVSYRCEGLLRDCLRSLDANRESVDMEVHVIDNDSQDKTADAAREFPWVKLTASNTNLGFSKANNLGIDQANSRAVLILNPDTVIPPDGLRLCLEELWKQPGVGLLSPRLVGPDGSFDRRCKRGFPTFLSIACYFSGLDQKFKSRRVQRYSVGWLPDNEGGEVESVSGAFMLMRADALSEVGGFDEQFFMYAEDMDLSLRFGYAGWTVYYWPGVDVIHIGAGSNEDGKRPEKANEAYFRTMPPFIRKHRPGIAGLVSAAAYWIIGEVLLFASRHFGALRGTLGGDKRARLD